MKAFSDIQKFFNTIKLKKNINVATAIFDFFQFFPIDLSLFIYTFIFWTPIIFSPFVFKAKLNIVCKNIQSWEP